MEIAHDKITAGTIVTIAKRKKRIKELRAQWHRLNAVRSNSGLTRMHKKHCSWALDKHLDALERQEADNA